MSRRRTAQQRVRRHPTLSNRETCQPAPQPPREGRQRNLVLILARSFAAQLATAVFLVDAEGTVIYVNEAAERLLGQRFIEGGGMAPEEWSTKYRPRDSEGHTDPLESLPLCCLAL